MTLQADGAESQRHSPVGPPGTDRSQNIWMKRLPGEKLKPEVHRDAG
jgi:hypothetical protein